MLQLIVGRVGYGKTEYVFSSINELIKKGENDIILITPEQFSFVAERKLLTMLGESDVNKVSNLSFTRLKNEVSKKYGKDKLPTLTKSGKVIMMNKAIETVKDNFKLYSKSCNTLSFVNSAIKIYDELKSCTVTTDDILKVVQSTDNENFANKLQDISSIMGAYDSIIKDEYYDNSTQLNRLYNTLIEQDYFVGKTVFIDGFSGFVAQEYKILEIILKQSKMVYVTFSSDSQINKDKYDLFSYINNNISILKNVAKKLDVNIFSTIYLSENHRANNETLKNIEKYAMFNNKEVTKVDSNVVNIFCANNISQECDNVSKQIVQLLRQGVGAKDISVITRDIEKYKKELEFSFNKFNIPFFDDQRQPINTQPLIMFIMFLLRVVIYSYKSEDVFAMIKTSMTSLSDNDISDFENYVYTWNINGSKFKKEFVNSTKGFVEEITDSDKKKIAKLNQTRQYIVEKTEKFKNSFKNNNAKEICSSLYKTLIDFSVDKNIRLLSKKLDDNSKSALAKEQGRIWDIVMDILNQIAVTSKNENVDANKFYKLFSLAVNSEDLGTIPSGLDNVQIGSAQRSRVDNPYAVFIVGANEGEFPQAVSSAGLLTENDRIALIENDFKLYSYGEILNAQERFFAYTALSSATDKLYISYIENPSSSYSEIVNGIMKTFDNVNINSCSSDISINDIESKENAFQIMSANYTNDSLFSNSLKQYFTMQPEYENRINAINNLIHPTEIKINNNKISTDLFKKDMYLSASRIEDFYNCSFKYFCKFGLNARPRAKAEIGAMQTGTAIHYVLEHLIKDNTSDKLIGFTDKEITMQVNKYLLQFLNTMMGDSSTFDSRITHQFMRISNMLCCVVMRLRDEFEQSDFKAQEFELPIGKDEYVKSPTFTLSDGGTVSISGSIDRVDTMMLNGKQYVRVVDYKSGTKDFLLNDIMYGINLQMFVYLFSLAKSDTKYNGVPSGVIYMHSSRKVISLKRFAKDEDIKKEENKEFKSKGLVLNDIDNQIVEHMDKKIKGDFAPVRIQNGVVTGNIASLEQMGKLSRKIDNLIVEMGNNLHEGNIQQNPISGINHDKTCEYCDYSFICKNRIEVNNREMTPRSNEQIFEILDKENEDAKLD